MKDKIKIAIKKGIHALIQEMVDFGAIVTRPVENPQTFTDFRVSIKDPVKYQEFTEFQKVAEKEIAREEYAKNKRIKEYEKSNI